MSQFTFDFDAPSGAWQEELERLAQGGAARPPRDLWEELELGATGPSPEWLLFWGTR